MIAKLDNTSSLVFRRTASHRGRQVRITPANSALDHLHYGRSILDAEHPSATLETGVAEVGLICLRGFVEVTVAGQKHELGPHDALYVPRDSLVQMQSLDADVLEFGAAVENVHPVQLVRFADVQRDPKLHFTAGDDSSRRELNVLIGANVQAGRIVGGFTRSAPGNWTSWPPHEHTGRLEEMYVFYDMPPPAMGVQFVFEDTNEPEVAAIVRDGDAVLMPRGYHPNVAVPGHGINFLWLMAARRESEDRVFGVVNVMPEFAAGGSGLEVAADGD